MKSLFRWVLLLLPAALVFGCSGEDEPQVEVTTPFKGQVDGRFVGSWAVEGRDTRYVFEKDGNYTLEGKVRTPGGEFDSHQTGQWLVDGERFLTQSQTGSVGSYKWTLEGNKLILALTGKNKNETVLLRQ